jgi:hypothetical protein
MCAVCPPISYSFIWCLVNSTNCEASHESVFFQPPVTYSLLRPDVFLSLLFSNALSLCFFRNVRDLVSHPYRTDKIIVLYALTFMFSRDMKSLWTEFPELNLICISHDFDRIQYKIRYNAEALFGFI